MRRTVLIYGLLLALLVFLLKILEYNFLVRSLSMEFYIGTVAIAFTVLGIWVGMRVTTRKKIAAAEQPSLEDIAIRLKKAGLSKREYEVLTLIAQGYSNQEIAEKLFVSLNTIKTHSSNVFVKLDVKRRSQVIQRAKELGLM